MKLALAASTEAFGPCALLEPNSKTGLLPAELTILEALVAIRV
jgi:hypothetical protein